MLERPSGFFTGTLDEVAIYNVALTQTQAYTHFVAGLQSAIGYKPVITPHSGPLAIRRVRFGQRNRYADAAVAGPQNLSLTTTDAVTTADVASRTAQLLRTITDAPSTADVVGRILAAIRSTSEAVSTADVATRSATFLRSATDAVSATQAATRIGTFLRSTSEAVSATQAATRSGTFLRTTSDAVTSSDAAVGVKVKNVSASDAVTTSESATRLLSALRTGTDAVTTSDTALRTELDSRQGTDTVTTSESVTRLLVALRTVTDAPTSSDAATRLLVALRTVTESVTANQAATRLLSALRASTDAVTTADVATRLASIVRSVTEAVSTADTATRQATLLRTTSDAVTTSESATATANARTTSDSVTTSDVATTGQVLSRTASDGLTLSDAATSSGGASSTGTGHPGRPRNPRYGRQVREEMTRKPTIEDIRRVTVLVATNDVLRGPGMPRTRRWNTPTTSASSKCSWESDMKALLPVKAKALEPDEQEAWFAGKVPRRILAIPFGGPIPSPKSQARRGPRRGVVQPPTDIYGDYAFLRANRERLVDFHHSAQPPGKGYGDPTGMMTGHVIGKSILDPDPDEDGWWSDFWFKAGEKRVALIKRLAERGAQLFGSSQPAKANVDKESGEILTWVHLFQTISPSPQNTLSVLRPKAILEDADLAGIPVSAAMRDLIEKMRDLDADLRRTSLAGDDGAKAGRELSRANDREIEAALDELADGYDRAQARLRDLLQRVRDRYKPPETTE